MGGRCLNRVLNHNLLDGVLVRRALEGLLPQKALADFHPSRRRGPARGAGLLVPQPPELQSVVEEELQVVLLLLIRVAVALHCQRLPVEVKLRAEVPARLKPQIQESEQLRRLELKARGLAPQLAQQVSQFPKDLFCPGWSEARRPSCRKAFRAPYNFVRGRAVLWSYSGASTLLRIASSLRIGAGRLESVSLRAFAPKATR